MSEETLNTLSDIEQLCKLSCNSCTYCKRAAKKKGISLAVVTVVSQCQELIFVNNVPCVNHLSSVKIVPNIQTVVPDLPVGSKLLHQFWGNLGSLGDWSKGHKNAQRRLHSSLPDPAKPDKVTDRHKLLCQSPQEPLPVGGITSANEQKYSRAGQK